MKYLISFLLLLSMTVGAAELSAQPPVIDTPASDAPAVVDETADGNAADNATETPDAAADTAADDTTEEESYSDDGDAAADEGLSITPVLDEMLESGAVGLLIKGGFFMWPILIMGIIATGVMIERYRSLKLLSGDSAALRSDVLDLLQQDQIERAYNLCEQEQGPVPAILGAGLRKFLVLRRLNYNAARIEEQVVKAMDDYSVHVVAALERHLPVLATVSSVAPMLGFLGTVQGMIVAFDAIALQQEQGGGNIVQAAAAGIGVALLTTCFGLIIGIPAFISFNYFTSVINRFVLDVESSATDLIETVTLHIAIESGEEIPEPA
jgi:biopolymer transport protein ExbB